MDVQSILGVVLELESELGKNDGQPIEPHGIHHSGGRYLGIHHRDGGRYSGIHHRDGGRYSGIHHRDGGRYSGIHHRDGGRYSGIHHRDGDRCSADAKFKGTEAAGDRERGRNPGDEESHGVDDDHGHYVSSDIAEDRALGHGGGDIDESLVRGTVRDPLVPPVREVGDLSRTGQSVYSQMEGGREEMKRTEGLDGACPAKEYTAETSYKKFPGAACLALSRPGDSIVDYPYVDFSSSQLMVMGDFVAADDTQKLHLEMLSDQPRTEAYRNVIMQNSTALKGKRILDLGCGTGIISFFCAQLAEPEIVYAVEASEISKQTRKLVEKNGFSSVVHVLCQRAEELQLPSKVDVLVSEWMGTCLVFEFMLESVLLARDLCLKEDGVMWPSTACVHLVPCSADEVYASRVLFWDALYGLDFSALKPMAIQEFFARPKPDYVLKPEDCLSQPCTLLDVNMKTLNIEDLEKMNSEFQFHVDRDGTFHGFTAWFSVQFQNIDNQDKVELNTGPFNPLTHWKHTLFMLDKPLQVHMGDQITGSVVFKRNPLWRRHLSVTITWSVTSSSLTPVQVSSFLLALDWTFDHLFD
ncbi:protein arginine N-methyltransferase 2 isoform X4 [Dendropsophus ebraccatus]|uniref:protein arginine N-methyltransferase 2 isoform X4 n=1 Tax=Dendropsophus ebraccatus TaxID=150705 RepID=UPI003831E77F